MWWFKKHWVTVGKPAGKSSVPELADWSACWWGEWSPSRTLPWGSAPSPPDRCGRARPPEAAGSSAWRAGWPAATGTPSWGLLPYAGSQTASPEKRNQRRLKIDVFILKRNSNVDFFLQTPIFIHIKENLDSFSASSVHLHTTKTLHWNSCA